MKRYEICSIRFEKSFALNKTNEEILNYIKEQKEGFSLNLNSNDSAAKDIDTIELFEKKETAEKAFGNKYFFANFDIIEIENKKLISLTEYFLTEVEYDEISENSSVIKISKFVF